MLIYATKFNVNKTFTKEQFVTSVINWCSTKTNPIKNLAAHASELNFCEIDDSQTIEVICIESFNLIASRVYSENSNGTWTVDAVLNYKDNTLAVYIDNTVGENTEIVANHRHVPQLISQIIDNDFAGTNLGFPISNSYITLDDSNKNTLLNAITSTSNELPVVYLSSRSKLKKELLASKLSGLAVVISDDNDVLFNNTDYKAPIYLFIPHKSIEPVAFDEYPMHRDIQHKIVEYLNSRSYNKLDTWDGIISESLKNKTQELIESLKKHNADNNFNSELLMEFESENEKITQQNEQLIAEVTKLRYENERLNSLMEIKSDEGSPVLVKGTEKDFYPDEQKEILIDILSEYLKKNLSEDSRRADIIQDIIEANPVKGIPNKYKKLIKEAFDGYSKFNTSKILNALDETGIIIAEHTGHYKLQYHGDHRYSFEAAATASDHRAGKNAAAIINKLMF